MHYLSIFNVNESIHADTAAATRAEIDKVIVTNVLLGEIAQAHSEQAHR